MNEPASVRLSGRIAELRICLDGDDPESLVQIEPRIVPLMQAKVEDEISLEHGS